MTIHSRRAAGPVLDALAARVDAGVPVLHWFSGSRRDLLRAIAQGCWFSVGPAMLAGERGRALAADMPRDRILTESDGPFARTDGRPLNPWDAAVAEKMLAEIWNVTEDEVSDQLMRNLKQLTSSIQQ